MGVLMLNLEIESLLNDRILGAQLVNEGCSIDGGFCAKCNFFNPRKFKPESKMSEGELFLLDVYKNMPENIKYKERRNFIPHKSKNGIWCILCDRCFKGKDLP